MANSRGKGFCFTHNNYTAADCARYERLFTDGVADGSILYAIVGKETAPTTGTPHLQGYVCFNERKRVGAVRQLFVGAHVEIARRSPEINRSYCSKGGDFVEFGDIQGCPSQGRRSDWEDYRQWLKDEPTWPSDAHIAESWISLYGRYGRRLLEIRDLLYKKPVLEAGAVRPGWQTELAAELSAEPVDDRKIVFYVDENGGVGKTWFVRKWLSEHDDAQMFSTGKVDDIAHALDASSRVIFFNVPREGMQYLQYRVLESIKDRLVFSPKYASRLKRMIHNPHVVVFCNEHPDMSKLTDDRYDVRII